MNDTSNFLFVYGTLRPGFDNAFAQSLRQQARYVGEGRFSGLLYDLGNYPGAVYQAGSATAVVGSIYDLGHNQEALLRYLDVYEGVGDEFDPPTEYIRIIIPVTLDSDGQTNTVSCWAYVYNHSVVNKPIIRSGDYRLFLQNRDYTD
jgi:gamma-glutamylcyclotransferase (GGCT)/AIG2-like uncharacterized protein YtfP